MRQPRGVRFGVRPLTHMNTDIIGLIGRKGSGKDTAAIALLDQGYVVVKFAGALKAMLQTYLKYVGVSEPYIDRLIEGDLKESYLPAFGGRSPRYAMQTLGTEWGRDIMSKTFWIEAFVRRCHQFPKVVCTDVRFPNEAAAIKELGGTLIRISGRTTDKTDTHSSENVDDLPMDAEIVNDSTIEQLHQRLLQII
jgi:hypothetical protein